MNKGLRWRVGSSVHKCWIGSYEKGKQRRVVSLVRPGMVVWDIGANAGFYTLGFSRLIGRDGRVYAFEPLPENVQNLLEHLDLNGVKNTTVIQGALADQVGLFPFALSASNALGALAPNGDFLVSTHTVDSILKTFPDAAPDLIKIDAEGAESRILLGAERLLDRGKVELLIALHSVQEWKNCLRILASHRYICSTLDGDPLTPDSVPIADIAAKPGH